VNFGNFLKKSVNFDGNARVSLTLAAASKLVSERNFDALVKPLLQQGQDRLRNRIGLRQRGEPSLLENLGLSKVCRFNGEVRINNRRPRPFKVFLAGPQHVDHAIEAILQSPKLGAKGGDLVDGAINYLKG
jgi:hypothetical protein